MTARSQRFFFGGALAAAALCFAPAAASAQTPEEAKEGFVSLFDGKTLQGWVGATDGYAVEDGAIYCIAKKGGNLFTEKEYKDFVLRFEFKLTENANNGLGVRAPLKGDAAYEGMELQVLDDGGSAYTKLQPYQYHGSVYGVAAAERGALKPVGEWNVQEVTLDGREVTVVLNGKKILSVNLDEAAKNGATIDHRPHPGLKRDQGRIGFLGHGHRVDFRNLRIKELTAAKASD